MRNFLNLILIICICSITLMFLTACNNDLNEYNLGDKITEEIKYTESKLIGIVNNFATGNYISKIENTEDLNKETNANISTEEEMNTSENITRLNYENILKDTRKIEDVSNRLIVDLATENVENEEITKLSDGINNMISNLYSEDEKTFLVELNNVFSLLPNFEAKVSNNNDEIFERRLKYFSISSYIAFYVGDKELAKTQVAALENEFVEKQKDIEYIEKHKYNLNKIYLLIEELKKAIDTDREELVREKYLLLIDEI